MNGFFGTNQSGEVFIEDEKFAYEVVCPRRFRQRFLCFSSSEMANKDVCQKEEIRQKRLFLNSDIPELVSQEVDQIKRLEEGSSPFRVSLFLSSPHNFVA